MNVLEKYNITEDDLRNTCANCNSAAEAAKLLGLKFSTFKRIALKYDCYATNQGGKGLHKSRRKVLVEDVLTNKVFYTSTFRFKRMLIDNGYFKDACYKCGWCEKREGEKYSQCELHHINGNRYDNSLENLIILCPNCHSLTTNYRSLNMCKRNVVKLVDTQP